MCNEFFSSGMEKIVVDPVKNVVMLRSTKWDHCITGHIDRAIVDGRVCTILYPLSSC